MASSLLLSSSSTTSSASSSSSSAARARRRERDRGGGGSGGVGGGCSRCCSCLCGAGFLAAVALVGIAAILFLNSVVLLHGLSSMGASLRTLEGAFAGGRTALADVRARVEALEANAARAEALERRVREAADEMQLGSRRIGDVERAVRDLEKRIVTLAGKHGAGAAAAADGRDREGAAAGATADSPGGDRGARADLPSDDPLLRAVRAARTKEAYLSAASRWFLQYIDSIQNPPDTAAGRRSENASSSCARVHICQPINSCGAGCSLHHLAYCFIAGLASRRPTLFSDGWAYFKGCDAGGGLLPWECLFEPMTHCPRPAAGMTAWSMTSTAPATVVHYWSRSMGRRVANFVPFAATDGMHDGVPFWIPGEIAAISEHLRDPRPWIVGHLLHYMMRPNKFLVRALDERVVAVPRPYVGMHIRRTDHGREWSFQDTHKYVSAAEKWFNTTHPLLRERHVYIASDDDNEHEHTIGHDTQFVWHWYDTRGWNKKWQISPTSRQNFDAMLALLVDWKMLVEADFLVGGFASQVSRLAHERAQVAPFGADRSKDYVSLDDVWYFP